MVEKKNSKNSKKSKPAKGTPSKGAGAPTGKGQMIGDILINRGLISQEQLTEALQIQKEWNMRLGEVLLGKGWVSAFHFYGALSEQLNLPFVNLLDDAPDPALLKAEDLREYVDQQYLPWRKEGDVVIYATSDPLSVQDFLAKKLGKGSKHKIHITSKFDILWTLQRRFPDVLTESALHDLYLRDPAMSAREVITPKQIIFLWLMLSLVMVGLYLDAQVTAIVMVALLSVFFLGNFIFRMMLAIVGGNPDLDHMISVDDVHELDDKDLPIYTVLVPMFREPEVLPILVAALRNLDYPMAKLDIKIILEEGDTETIDAAKAMALESTFEIIRVPPSVPQTKPKACNYALAFARGELVVIYDAEDLPEPDQLKKALVAFRRGDDNVACLQSRLNFYNWNENWLSKLFTIDYSLWFDFMLPALDHLRLPIPLGGTSNHFKADILRELGAWDPYNVTEDCDLGVRMSQKGYKIGVINSTTYEEANVKVGNWIRQRSRWLKGYMQSYLVHMRSPLTLYREIGGRAFFGFQLFVGGNIIMALANPIFWGLYGFWLWTRTNALEPYFPDVIAYICVINLVVGNAAFIYLAMLSPLKRNLYDLVIFALLVPVYWILQSVAAYRGLYQLMTRPFFWEKTEHGLSVHTMRAAAPTGAGLVPSVRSAVTVDNPLPESEGSK